MFTQKIKRKDIMILFLGLSSWFFFIGPTLGATPDYPVKPIFIHVGFPPGAAASISAQIFAEGAKGYLPTPQPILINHKPGASGAISADFVLKQPRDGYNLLWVPADLIIKLAKDGPQLHFVKEDFIPIGTITTTTGILTVNKGSPFKGLEDFISYAKENPGKLSYGSVGFGSTHHLYTEILMLKCGIKMNHIPFAGGAAAAAALLGGHIDCQLLTMLSGGPHLQPGGGLRALAVLGPKRLPDLPDVPTCLEKGYAIELDYWWYLAAAKGTPKPMLDILLETFKKTADDSQVKANLFKAGFTPLKLTPEETENKGKWLFDLAVEIFKKTGLK